MSKIYQKSVQKSTRKSQKSKDSTDKNNSLSKKKLQKALKKKKKTAKKKNANNTSPSPKRTPQPTEPLFTQGDISINNVGDLKDLLNDSLHSYAIELGMEIANELLEEDVAKWCGSRSERVLKRRMNAAYESNDFDAAKKILEQTVEWLEGKNTDAARSLEEGLEETLTVIRLGVTGELRKRLDNTNTIESMFSRVRDITHRVKRWRDGNMRHRWCVAGLMRAEAGFRKMRGYRDLPALQQSLTTFILDKQAETV
ncbi:hypothetical protein MNBD_PLANCTO02-1729 [hydrothermal vent metagenome]|uniref:Uncharacterized protein n=1 Tax=hydrothermal vent metagenome TaxID=652676 RepID=A0A3B1DZ08_9ZZZZ